jgi:hypothetical protein
MTDGAAATTSTIAANMDDLLLSSFAAGFQIGDDPDPALNFYIPAHVQPHLRLIRDGAAHRVMCKSELPAEAFLGYVTGSYMYSWDIGCYDAEAYLFVVDDDYVINVTEEATPSILAFVREGHCNGLTPNVGIVPEPMDVRGVAQGAKNAGPRIGLKTLRAIRAGEELIYNPGRFYECGPFGPLGG